MNTAMTEAKGQMLHAVPCLERASDCWRDRSGYRQACTRGAGGRPLAAGVHQAKGSPNVLPVCYVAGQHKEPEILLVAAYQTCICVLSGLDIL